MAHAQLPSKDDFDPHGNDLDAGCAWRNFGGLTLDEAYAQSLENPLYYQEDFMFMGGRAFAYYFPVIERYLLETSDEEQQAVILACGIRFQFQGGLDNVRHLAPRVIELAQYVLANISRFGDTESERRQVALEWSRLLDLIKSGTHT